MSNPSETLASAADCRPLYALMDQLKVLAPWDWMLEQQIMGVHLPDGQSGFVSVMGSGGDHFGISVYVGASGIHGFERMQQLGPRIELEDFLYIPQLQASWEDRDQIAPPDRAILKQLGLKYRGAQAWVLFRSYRPGFMPYFITTAEASLLEAALGQLLVVAPRVRAERKLLKVGRNKYFMRVAQQHGDQLVWHDEVQPRPPLPTATMAIQAEADLVAQVLALPVADFTLEADYFLVPSMHLGTKDERPRFGHVLLVVEREHGMVVATEMLDPYPGLDALWQGMPNTMLRVLTTMPALPRQIDVRSELLLMLLQPLKKMGVKLRQRGRLPALNEAKDALLRFM